MTVKPDWLRLGLRGMEQEIKREVDGALLGVVTRMGDESVRLHGVHAKYCDKQGRVVQARWNASHIEVIAYTLIIGGTPFVVGAMRAHGHFTRVERFDGTLPDDWPGADLKRRRDTRRPAVFAMITL